MNTPAHNQLRDKQSMDNEKLQMRLQVKKIIKTRSFVCMTDLLRWNLLFLPFIRNSYYRSIFVKFKQEIPVFMVLTVFLYRLRIMYVWSQPDLCLTRSFWWFNKAGQRPNNNTCQDFVSFTFPSFLVKMAITWSSTLRENIRYIFVIHAIRLFFRRFS